MTEIEMPGRIARLRRDKHGRPVPWFVAWLDVEGNDVWPPTDGALPDFRIIKPGAVVTAHTSGICWVCGTLFLRQEPRVFVIGPMCAVNRNTAEPPAHYHCARYSALACPFLAHPNMIRRERRLPPGVAEPPGIMIRRNPGVALLWVSKYNNYGIQREPRGGLLFRLGDPIDTEWFAQGREATRAEVMESIDTGIPLLREQCASAGEADALDKAYRAALRYVPA